MRILQINSAKNFGGGEKHLVDLCGGLAAQGHEIFVSVRPSADWIEKLSFLPNENIFKLPLRNSFDAASARNLARIIKEKNIEILHAHLARDYMTASLAVRFAPPAKLMLTRHLLFPLSNLYKFVFPKTTKLIAVSEAVKQQLLKQKIVAPQNIELILNGIDTKYYQQAQQNFDRTEFCHQFNLPVEKRFVGIAGEIVAHKGQTDLVRAAALLADNFPGVNFLIAGTDNSKEKSHLANLEKLIDELNLKNRVHLLGWINDIAQFLCALDVFVSASRVEPFGLVIVEAMACRRAIVATKSEGASEILTDNKTAILTPLEKSAELSEAIGKFLANESVRKSFGGRAQIEAREKFDLERMVSETERIYKEISTRV